MKSYRVKFTPTEPYFFGNEKSSKFPKYSVREDGDKLATPYYIRSELMPSQTTIFGALRFILLPVKHSNFRDYTATEQELNSQVVGENSFDIDSKDKQSFGKILGLSPIFIVKDTPISDKDTVAKGELIPMPFDHISGNETYTPFSDYETVTTPDGERYITKQYKSKDGVADCFVHLADSSTVSKDKIFGTVTRVGINRFTSKNGFFKKEYAFLLPGFSFAAYVTLADDIEPQDGTVFLGQGKSAFHVTFSEEEENLSEKIKCILPKNTVYCFGDAFADSELYNQILFAVTDTKDYRAYKTSNGKVEKGPMLNKLIKAGSIFIPRDTQTFIKHYTQNNNLTQIGFNKFITKEGE